MVDIDPGQSFTFPDPAMDATVSESQSIDVPVAPKVQVVAPEPLPTFVFPALNPAQASSSADADSGPTQLPSHGISTRMPSNLHSRRKSVTPLPAFNFHPGQIGPHEGKISPKTPDASTAQSPPPRSGGHRRGGSEFIGGDGKSGGLGLMSASPTKRDNALPLPRSQASPDKPDGRRGHAHRRSGAISCHDLSAILRPSAVGISSRPESAPTSPVDTNVFPTLESVGLNDNAEGDPTPRRSPGSWPLRRGEGGSPRARVGFSDNVEIIPRGLSPLSSEASSSQTSIYGIESTPGSISSIISASSNNGNGVTSENLIEQKSFGHRPTSAGPVLARRGSAEETPCGDMGLAFRRPNPMPISKRSTSAEGGGSSEDDVFHPVDGSPPRSFLWSKSERPARARNNPGPERPAIESGPSMARRLGADPPNTVPSLGPKKVRRVAKSQEKTSRWAGSILSRRGRPKQRLAVRPTPIPPLHALPPREASPDIDFDHDDTTVIVSPTFKYSIPPPTSTGSEDLPGQGSSSLTMDSMTPVIDLDAPPDTVQTGLRSKEGPKNGFEGAKRRMHSFGAAGGFRGPGLDYHRRTESAPELAGFEFGRSSLHRLRNSATMADVFEEDEEDEAEVKKGGCGAKASKQKDFEGVGMGIHVVDSNNQNNARVMNWENEDSHPNQENSSKTQEIGQSKTFAADEVTGKERSVKTVVGAAHQVKHDGEAVVTEDRSQSWPSVKVAEAITEPVAENARRGSIASGSVGFGLPHQYQDHMTAEAPSLTVSSSTSPELATSTFDQPSVQTPSVFTSGTSITEERMMPSWSIGEPSPDMRMSTDDIPSLASDNTSAIYSYASPGSRPYSNDGGAPGITVRSGSMASYATSGSGLAISRPVTVKRSSLVSLSRFVSGSRGEKSKLSIEEKPQPGSPEKTGKEKKTKRFGRLMSFLKPKHIR